MLDTRLCHPPCWPSHKQRLRPLTLLPTCSHCGSSSCSTSGLRLRPWVPDFCRCVKCTLFVARALLRQWKVAEFVDWVLALDVPPSVQQCCMLGVASFGRAFLTPFRKIGCERDWAGCVLVRLVHDSPRSRLHAARVWTDTLVQCSTFPRDTHAHTSISLHTFLPLTLLLPPNHHHTKHHADNTQTNTDTAKQKTDTDTHTDTDLKQNVRASIWCETTSPQ